MRRTSTHAVASADPVANMTQESMLMASTAFAAGEMVSYLLKLYAEFLTSYTLQLPRDEESPNISHNEIFRRVIEHSRTTASIVQPSSTDPALQNGAVTAVRHAPVLIDSRHPTERIEQRTVRGLTPSILSAAKTGHFVGVRHAGTDTIPRRYCHCGRQA